MKFDFSPDMPKKMVIEALRAFANILEEEVLSKKDKKKNGKRRTKS